jgi:hypothetical protein
MWICLNNAFVSIVAVPEQPDQLMVRARHRTHIRKLFPKAKLITTPYPADYRYRVVVSRAEVIYLLAQRVNELDYTNFKNSVVYDDLHDMYHDMWTIHWKFQKGVYNKQGGSVNGNARNRRGAEKVGHRENV